MHGALLACGQNIDSRSRGRSTYASDIALAVVDDQSPRVAYAGDWFRNGIEGAWNSTLSGTETANSSATLKFRGNRVAVYGAVLYTEDQGPPQSSYALDDGTPSLWIPSTDDNNTFATFFVSPLLADGDHTLTIELLSHGSPLYLDYFLYNMSESMLASATVAPPSMRPTIVTTIIRAPTSVAMAAESGGSSLPVGPIVGGVVGGVAVLVAALLAVYFLYWVPTRNRASYYYHTTSTEDWDHTDTKPLFLGSAAAPHTRQSSVSVASTVTAYPPPPPSASSISVYSTHTADSRQPSISAISRPPLERHDTVLTSPSEYSSYTETDTLSRAGSAAAGPSTPPLVLANTAPLRIAPRPRKAAEAGARTSSAESVHQHTDSGYRFDAAGPSRSQPPPQADHPDELPPVYSES